MARISSPFATRFIIIISATILAVTAQNTNVCNSNTCQQWSKFLKDSLHPDYATLDPCVDFDKYACTGWRANNDYRPEQSSTSVMTVMKDVNQKLLRTLLEGQYSSKLSGSNRTYDEQNFNKMKNAYQACMDESTIKSRGITALQKMLKDAEDVFPAVATTSDSVAELTKAMAYTKKQHVDLFTSYDPTEDPAEPSTMMINLLAGEISLEKKYYSVDAVMANYTVSIASMLYVLDTGNRIALNASIPSDKSESYYADARVIVAFEKILANNTADPELQGDTDYTYVPKSLRDVRSLVPEVDWTALLQDIVPAAYPLGANRTVIVGDINYFKNLSNVIKSTPRRTLQLYVRWRLISQWSPRFDASFSVPLTAFKNVLEGKKPDSVKPRWDTCISEVSDKLSHALGAMYIQRQFPIEDKTLGDDVILAIRKEFKERLSNIDWMAEEAKKMAGKKVDLMVQSIGYQTERPNEVDSQSVADHYSSLKMSDDYLQNEINALGFSLNKTWQKLLAPKDRSQWEMSSETVNAYYLPTANQIVFPAGIMQFPNFNHELPDYVNFGSFGATVGHEITHGFDEEGAKYNEKGVLRSWWDNGTTTHFKQRSECFVKQYANYSVEGLHGERVPINGRLTLGENIADAGGLNSAYAAWKRGSSGKPELALPGLEQFNGDKLFFLSYATSWCRKVRKEALFKQVLSDPHAPFDVRLIGSLENSMDFKRVFNCPSKQAKCQLW